VRCSDLPFVCLNPNSNPFLHEEFALNTVRDYSEQPKSLKKKFYGPFYSKELQKPKYVHIEPRKQCFYVAPMKKIRFKSGVLVITVFFICSPQNPYKNAKYMSPESHKNGTRIGQ
jgi:hypothetical protein